MPVRGLGLPVCLPTSRLQVGWFSQLQYAWQFIVLICMPCLLVCWLVLPVMPANLITACWLAGFASYSMHDHFLACFACLACLLVGLSCQWCLLAGWFCLAWEPVPTMISAAQKSIKPPVVVSTRWFATPGWNIPPRFATFHFADFRSDKIKTAIRPPPPPPAGQEICKPSVQLNNHSNVAPTMYLHVRTNICC